MLKSWIAVLLLVLIWPLAGAAVAVDEPLPDPAMEQRARAIHKELRCLVCQNQSIEDSNADLARDLRRLVRERLAAGDSDEATIEFIVERYGDWVLLTPPVQANTLLLWASPLLLLVLGGFGFLFWYRRQKTGAGAAGELSEAERARLHDLLDDGARR